MTVHYLKTAYCYSCRTHVYPPRLAGNECHECVEFQQDERDTDLDGIEDLLEANGCDVVPG